jgi:hypothetical protein
MTGWKQPEEEAVIYLIAREMSDWNDRVEPAREEEGTSDKAECSDKSAKKKNKNLGPTSASRRVIRNLIQRTTGYMCSYRDCHCIAADLV